MFNVYIILWLNSLTVGFSQRIKIQPRIGL
jgi:hypothetical protein